MKIQIRTVTVHASLHEWLGHELEERGVDAVIYTRYILSLLQQDSIDRHEAEEVLTRVGEERLVRSRRQRKGRRGSIPGDGRRLLLMDTDELKKLAAIECLLSVADKDCDVEGLVEELYRKLKDCQREDEQQHQQQQTKQQLQQLKLRPRIRQKSEGSSGTLFDSPERQAQKYYAAFPALTSRGLSAPVSPTPPCDPKSNSVWHKHKLQLNRQPQKDTQQENGRYRSGEKGSGGSGGGGASTHGYPARTIQDITNTMPHYISRSRSVPRDEPELLLLRKCRKLMSQSWPEKTDPLQKKGTFIVSYAPKLSPEANVRSRGKAGRERTKLSPPAAVNENATRRQARASEEEEEEEEEEELRSQQQEPILDLAVWYTSPIDDAMFTATMTTSSGSRRRLFDRSQIDDDHQGAPASRCIDSIPASSVLSPLECRTESPVFGRRLYNRAGTGEGATPEEVMGGEEEEEGGPTPTGLLGDCKGVATRFLYPDVPFSFGALPTSTTEEEEDEEVVPAGEESGEKLSHVVTSVADLVASSPYDAGAPCVATTEAWPPGAGAARRWGSHAYDDAWSAFADSVGAATDDRTARIAVWSPLQASASPKAASKKASLVSSLYAIDASSPLRWNDLDLAFGGGGGAGRIPSFPSSFGFPFADAAAAADGRDPLLLSPVLLGCGRLLSPAATGRLREQFYDVKRQSLQEIGSLLSSSVGGLRERFSDAIKAQSIGGSLQEVELLSSSATVGTLEEQLSDMKAQSLRDLELLSSSATAVGSLEEQLSDMKAQSLRDLELLSSSAAAVGSLEEQLGDMVVGEEWREAHELVESLQEMELLSSGLGLHERQFYDIIGLSLQEHFYDITEQSLQELELLKNIGFSLDDGDDAVAAATLNDSAILSAGTALGRLDGAAATTDDDRIWELCREGASQSRGEGDWHLWDLTSQHLMGSAAQLIESLPVSSDDASSSSEDAAVVDAEEEEEEEEEEGEGDHARVRRERSLSLDSADLYGSPGKWLDASLVHSIGDVRHDDDDDDDAVAAGDGARMLRGAVFHSEPAIGPLGSGGFSHHAGESKFVEVRALPDCLRAVFLRHETQPAPPGGAVHRRAADEDLLTSPMTHFRPIRPEDEAVEAVAAKPVAEVEEAAEGRELSEEAFWIPEISVHPHAFPLADDFHTYRDDDDDDGGSAAETFAPKFKKVHPDKYAQTDETVAPGNDDDDAAIARAVAQLSLGVEGAGARLCTMARVVESFLAGPTECATMQAPEGVEAESSNVLVSSGEEQEEEEDEEKEQEEEEEGDDAWCSATSSLGRDQAAPPKLEGAAVAVGAVSRRRAWPELATISDGDTSSTGGSSSECCDAAAADIDDLLHDFPRSVWYVDLGAEPATSPPPPRDGDEMLRRWLAGSSPAVTSPHVVGWLPAATEAVAGGCRDAWEKAGDEGGARERDAGQRWAASDKSRGNLVSGSHAASVEGKESGRCRRNGVVWRPKLEAAAAVAEGDTDIDLTVGGGGGAWTHEEKPGPWGDRRHGDGWELMLTPRQDMECEVWGAPRASTEAAWGTDVVATATTCDRTPQPTWKAPIEEHSVSDLLQLALGHEWKGSKHDLVSGELMWKTPVEELNARESSILNTMETAVKTGWKSSQNDLVSGELMWKTPVKESDARESSILNASEAAVTVGWKNSQHDLVSREPVVWEDANKELIVRDASRIGASVVGWGSQQKLTSGEPVWKPPTEECNVTEASESAMRDGWKDSQHNILSREPVWKAPTEEQNMTEAPALSMRDGWKSSQHNIISREPVWNTPTGGRSVTEAAEVTTRDGWKGSQHDLVSGEPLSKAPGKHHLTTTSDASARAVASVASWEVASRDPAWIPPAEDASLVAVGDWASQRHSETSRERAWGAAVEGASGTRDAGEVASTSVRGWASQHDLAEKERAWNACADPAATAAATVPTPAGSEVSAVDVNATWGSQHDLVGREPMWKSPVEQRNMLNTVEVAVRDGWKGSLRDIASRGPVWETPTEECNVTEASEVAMRDGWKGSLRDIISREPVWKPLTEECNLTDASESAVRDLDGWEGSQHNILSREPVWKAPREECDLTEASEVAMRDGWNGSQNNILSREPVWKPPTEEQNLTEASEVAMRDGWNGSQNNILSREPVWKPPTEEQNLTEASEVAMRDGWNGSQNNILSREPVWKPPTEEQNLTEASEVAMRDGWKGSQNNIVITEPVWKPPTEKRNLTEASESAMRDGWKSSQHDIVSGEPLWKASAEERNNASLCEASAGEVVWSTSRLDPGGRQTPGWGRRDDDDTDDSGSWSGALLDSRAWTADGGALVAAPVDFRFAATGDPAGAFGRWGPEPDYSSLAAWPDGGGGGGGEGEARPMRRSWFERRHLAAGDTMPTTGSVEKMKLELNDEQGALLCDIDNMRELDHQGAPLRDDVREEEALAAGGGAACRADDVGTSVGRASPFGTWSHKAAPGSLGRPWANWVAPRHASSDRQKEERGSDAEAAGPGANVRAGEGATVVPDRHGATRSERIHQSGSQPPGFTTRGRRDDADDDSVMKSSPMASSDGKMCGGEASSETGEGQTASSLETLYIPREKCVFSSDLEEEWRKSSKPFHVQVPRKLGVRAAKEMCKRPCSFFLEGHCRRADCKFSHNISGITCRFWEEGSCFKGITCPFLHGYPTEEQLQRGLASSPSTSDNEAMFELELEAREEKGKEDEDVATSDGSGGSSKSDDSSARARYQRVRRKLARISHPRNKVFKSHSKSAPIDIKARK